MRCDTATAGSWLDAGGHCAIRPETASSPAGTLRPGLQPRWRHLDKHILRSGSRRLYFVAPVSRAAPRRLLEAASQFPFLAFYFLGSLAVLGSVLLGLRRDLACVLFWVGQH